MSNADPTSEIPVHGDDESITLPDGRSVPTKVVQALAEYDTTWPGSVLPQARAAVIATVMNAALDTKGAVLRTNYAFCLDDDPKVPDKASPCVRHASHDGKHKDNDDGVW